MFMMNRRSITMATFAEIQQTLTDTGAALSNLATGIEDLALRIQALQAGQVMTQAELDGLNAQAQASMVVAQDAANRVGALAPPAP
jgi:hypothetical protein